VLLFAVLTVGWTWPLAAHLGDAIPGDGGDNYSFLWNLWWMRHVLASPGLAYFHTNYLFYPFGTTIADHPHTALPAFVAATVLRHWSIVTAQNLLLLACVFANMASMYALAWDITRHRRAATFAGMMFGTSPYLAAQLLGHFDLIAAWLLPLFGLCFRRALDRGSRISAAAAGVVMAATAYTAYYYLVYLWLFVAVYSFAWMDALAVSWTRRPRARRARRVRGALLGGMGMFGVLATWIAASGGGELRMAGLEVSARTPQNALTAVWICALAFVLTEWRPSLVRRTVPATRTRRAVVVVAVIAAIFLIAAMPLLRETARLVARGEYVTPAYMWRSAPRGVDLVTAAIGPPAHPFVRSAVDRAYAVMHLDRIEGVGWMGVLPVLLLLLPTGAPKLASPDLRAWRIVAVGFLLWALGPFLTIAGHDTGLKLPETIVRYVPFVANARMPGRAMVGVFMAAAVLLAARISAADGRLERPAMQWLLVGVLAFEYWDAPVPLTRLDTPAVYRQLATSPPGAVCEVPFGIGDGLSAGIGSQDRRVLYYATLHEHPLVGGYIGRMPADAARRYEEQPLTASLLRLSEQLGTNEVGRYEQAPCRYFVVNRNSVPASLRRFIETLPADRIGTDDTRDLYRVRE